MKNKASIFIILAFLIILALSSASAVSGQENGPDTIARRGSNTQVQWRPQVAYESATLTVTGPNGYTFQQTFSAGVTPYFQSVNADGTALPAGSYTYEIQLTPKLSAETKAGLVSTTDREAYINELTEAGIIPDSSQLTLWGYLTVDNGKFIANNVEEPAYDALSESSTTSSANDLVSPSTINDQQILDDLIVVGSICVGQDCSNGESFGFDTLRLKENNLRIRAFDTSNSASFPSRDWQITFNDSSNGGANKFSIDDIDGGRTPFTIEAGAPSHSLYVDDGGRLGFGTSTPVVELHVKDGDTPTMRLEQDGSSGFTAQTWDVAGNEAGFFVRDVTNGSTLPFRILPDADSESLVIEGTNDVGIGAGTNPQASLHVRRSNGTANLLVEEINGTTEQRALLTLKNNGASIITLQDSSTGGEWKYGLYTGDNFEINRTGTGGSELLITPSGEVKMGPGGVSNFFLDVNGNLTTAGTVNGVSSRTQKENLVQTDGDVLDRVMDLPVYFYNYIDDGDAIQHVGPMSEDFAALFEVGIDDKHISPFDMAGVAIAAVQEVYESVELNRFELRVMQNELISQQERIEELEAQNADLEARLAALEAIVLAQMEQEGDR